MPNKKPYKPKKPKLAEAREPLTFYADTGKKIVFFQSHKQQEIYELKQMAAMTPAERLHKLEEMRKFFLRQFLLPNGDWPPVRRTITFTKPVTE
ncbi:MAG: hypothetical protein KDC56_06050 [Flavobacteriaceae bacterium]|nr:hypothetical protein [Flavobacteriaceae bacterium]